MNSLGVLIVSFLSLVDSAGKYLLDFLGSSSDCSLAAAAFRPRWFRKGYMLTEYPIRNIKMKHNQEGVYAVPDCKGKPSFGPILMSNDLTFKACVDCKEPLVHELIERAIAKNVPFEMLDN